MTSPLLLATVLVIATCGLVYELLAGTLASYLLGDSITQFSTIIGAYLSSMGLGSFLSKYIDKNIARRFVEVELLVALVGGLSAPILFLSFAYFSAFRMVLYPFVGTIGVLVGLEIPLLLRILKDHYEFKDLIARVLTFDYIGALVASLLFPILLVPKMGLVRTGVLFGLLNALVGLISTSLLKSILKKTTWLRVQALVVIAIMLGAFVGANELTSLAEDGMYADEIVFASQTRYQRIVITRGRGSFQLFLNGSLQFSSADEYRYHEALVHPAMALNPTAKKALVLGGGDGLALRELLKYPGLEKIVLVDLDPEMVETARENPLMRALNKNAYFSPKVRVVNEDAYFWVQSEVQSRRAQSVHGLFDVVIIDFPDPNNFSLGKLYTTQFYRMIYKILSPGAPMAVQSTSPLMARASYWCIARTIEASGFFIRPYHVAVPSFGEWGFVLAKKQHFEVPASLATPISQLRFLTNELVPQLFVLPKDMGSLPIEVNRLNNQILVHYHESDWRRWN